MKLRIDDLNLAYDDCGHGPAVLLIHGFPLNRQMWQPQLEPLAAAGYRLLAPDLRGFGASDVPSSGYSIDRFADDIIALLDSLDIEQAAIGGMSMGGYILLNLLERYPGRVRAACFIATKSADDDEAGRARRTVMAAEAERMGANPITKIFAELLFAPGTSEEHPELIAQVTSWMRDTNPQALAGGLLAMRDRKDYTPLLPKISQPCLVLSGREDRAASPDAVSIFTSHLPDCQSVAMEKAGHMLNLERPAEFNAILLNFLNGLKERR
ncbi:alpha/beta hydrolase [Geomonas sp. Red32]|uniref:alpha/beta fold hydrolase n=1 Tax=Geomonas sp. Red32 TaxID=2912856 RepID=UPI00202D0135|nr:alpha/beta hydrolase [Geomonas sp. Red32]MCM0080373.1 alpha/beta hydrolase [Geomonas sp. Red32]